MAYRLPNFNLLMNAWACAGTPNGGPPDYEDLRVQKYLTPKMVLDATMPWTVDYFVEWSPPIVLRVDRTQSPFDLTWKLWDVGIAECPAGSGQYYRVMMSEIMHEGFPNEYGMLMCTQCDGDGKVYQPPGHAIPTGMGDSAC